MERDDWDDYRFVLALYQRGSLGAAAKALDVNETTVARRLAQVERAFDTTLFERVRGRIEATTACERIVNRLVLVDDQLRRVREEVSGANKVLAGNVRVTTTPTFANEVLVPRLPELLEKHEALNLEFLVDTALLGIAREREADIAIRATRPTSDADAVTRKIGQLEYGVYCHRDLLSRNREPGWIAYESRWSGFLYPRWLEDQLALDQQAARMRVNDGETLFRCVRAGIGKSTLPHPLARRYPELVELPATRPPPTREIWMLMHPSYRQTRRIAIVVEWLQVVLAEYLCEGSER